MISILNGVCIILISMGAIIAGPSVCVRHDEPELAVGITISAPFFAGIGALNIYKGKQELKKAKQ